ncbi:ABC transporter permease [Sphaerisporangium krabiense]|uniref:Peptide/nickel transport system permease protein n=1 Tax=Sphaerisporangium krabiense TaxID=763782 RepID=A0A7W8YYY6_9ACTN|nr:ABC transporter permease [Sphaerisporangium krabiense]MBB5624361.1 peptide/nickel transport system permease protein [Sphaerisporangium krabiense]GII61686.1 ABC transporter permease [Sphaerisporangium krabiense]
MTDLTGVFHPDAAATEARGTALRGGAREVLAFLARRPGLLLALAWVALVLLAAFAPGLLTSADPLAAVPADKLTPPSAGHPLGTDELGRDLYARTVHGAALSLKATIIAVSVGLATGTLLGLLGGFLRGWVDDVIMRVADVLLAIPALLLSLALVVVLGFGTVNVAIAVGVASVATCARVMRAEVLRVRHSLYVEAAHAGGARRIRVLVRHVLPNSSGPVLVLAALEFGTSILAVSALSFLGYGAQPPAPEWGSLISAGRDYLSVAWWMTTMPGLTIAATVLAANRISRLLDGEWRHGR